MTIGETQKSSVFVGGKSIQVRLKSYVSRLFCVSVLLGLTAAVILISSAGFGLAAANPLAVTDISPNNGPIAGGTLITITGSGLMGEYEQVESIYFDGDSYIQTDVTQLNLDMSVRIKPDVYDAPRFVVGAANDLGRQIYAVERSGGNGNIYKFYTGADGTASTLTTTNIASVPAVGMVDISYDWTRVAHINGSQTASSGSTNPNIASYYQIGGTNSYSNYFKGDFLQMKLSHASTGEVTNYFVPAHKIGTDTYGVVDLNTGKFYGNAGSGTITGGAVVPGSVSPDRPTSVTIDGRACTGIEFQSDTQLTCHTPSGLNLGKKNVVVSAGNESTNVADGFEYALRLNSVLPKYGDPSASSEITIEGGVFSTPPDSYVSASASGIKFDGSSWIATGFDQIGSTSYAVDFKLPATAAPLNTGFMGSRSTGSSGSFLIWQLAQTNFRFDYGSSSGATKSYISPSLLNVRSEVVIDDGYARVNDTRVVDRAKLDFSNLLPAEMLLGSLTTGSGYGTNSFAAYSNYGGTIYSAQICKEKSRADAAGVIYQESPLCDPPGVYNASTNPTGTQIAPYVERSSRVLVRDLRASMRITDNVCGFYDMVTGEFLTNAGYGKLTCEADISSNTLEVPLELSVVFSGDDGGTPVNGICANPRLVDGVTIKCTMPVSPFSGGGNGKVDLKVFANGVEATPGTVDADDYYYGAPMVAETISPNRGPIGGGQLVKITGNNFFPDDNPSTHDPATSWEDIVITIGGSACNLRSDSNGLLEPQDYTNTSLTCVTTSNTGGVADIEVDNGRSQYTYRGSIDPITGAVTSGYLYEDQLISVAPNNGPSVGGEMVSIRGNHFITSGSATTSVYFGGALATNVTVASGSLITARTPAHAPGLVDILVVQNGYAASLSREATGAYEYTFESTTGAISPNRGYITGGEIVTIDGSFDPNAEATVTFGDIPATEVTVIDETKIKATAPAHEAGRVSVTVSQYESVSTLENAFTYVPPLTITSVTPNRGPIEGGTVVIINGQSFVPVGSTASANFANLVVSFGGSLCVAASVADYTDTMIKCTTSAHASGVVDVSVSAGNGASHSSVYSGELDPSTGKVLSGYMYVISEISLSASTVRINLPVQSIGMGSTDVYTRTDNPTGYYVSIRADDESSATTNDNWLKCSEFTINDRFLPVAANGVLTDNTWGWAVGESTPDSWKPMLGTDNMMISPTGRPTGPNEDGAVADAHTLWFGARAGVIQSACTYSARVVITVVAD